MTARRSSPHFTDRSRTLLEAARSDIRDGEVIVDLGAGSRAVLAARLQELFPASRIIAVEPSVEVDAPEGIQVVRGDISQLPEGCADVVLFNSPNTPDRFLDPADGSHHQFSGGPNGYDVLHGVLVDAPSRLRDGGRIVFICPTFTPLPDAIAPEDVELLAAYAEPRDPFLERAPVREEARAEFGRFLDSRSRKLRRFWSAVGAPEIPDTVGAVVMRWQPANGPRSSGAT